MFKPNCLQPFAYKNTSNITQMYKVFRYKKNILVLQEHQGSLQVLKTYSYGTTNMYLFQAKFPFCVKVLLRIWGCSSPCLCFTTQAIKHIKKIKEAYNVQIQSAKLHNFTTKTTHDNNISELQEECTTSNSYNHKKRKSLFKSIKQPHFWIARINFSMHFSIKKGGGPHEFPNNHQ